MLETLLIRICSKLRKLGI